MSFFINRLTTRTNDRNREALYQEQVKYFGTGEPGQFRPIQYEDIKKLPVLDAVIRETLRMYPAVNILPRV